jgi:hypothetical protein
VHEGRVVPQFEAGNDLAEYSILRALRPYLLGRKAVRDESCTHEEGEKGTSVKRRADGPLGSRVKFEMSRNEREERKEHGTVLVKTKSIADVLVLPTKAGKRARHCHLGGGPPVTSKLFSRRSNRDWFQASDGAQSLNVAKYESVAK